MRKILLLFLTTLTLFSCSEDKEEIVEQNSNSSSSTTSTEVRLTLKTLEGNTKTGYIVMVFDKVFDPTKSFSPSDAVFTASSDNNGKVTFNFENKAEGTYYFEAFTKDGEKYTLKSRSRVKLTIKKGSVITSEILVN